MEFTKLRISPLLVGFLFVCSVALVHGWGNDGHLSVCRLAQPRLSEAAANAVKDLLPAYAEDDLGSLCSWADRVKFRRPWSSPLHYIDTPDDLCTYQYTRDCKDADGIKDRCVVGAINNYTTQLLTYGQESASQYNLTEALLFLSHFMGDIHQPLHVWDNNIIDTAEERYDDSDVTELIDAIQTNITATVNRVKTWEGCTTGNPPCPDVYATESIKAACNFAYKGVTEESVLEDPYFLTRVPIVYLRLAQGGVRLAATLNSIFG
ncbi:OLC1v1032263C1 [Oldenlandia corymbosa var. corymbosa]|uniref:Aspergillus nuclease S1 n=1 Tax=Oldenlandia corymbosa var. corymbosa TaxID=529605 RepID=A0AAV1CNH1_OLDCO|nr:OLC1v1032263C1 [Oldenlandia corymbosa var. corymbosa]